MRKKKKNISHESELRTRSTSDNTKGTIVMQAARKQTIYCTTGAEQELIIQTNKQTNKQTIKKG